MIKWLRKLIITDDVSKNIARESHIWKSEIETKAIQIVAEEWLKNNNGWSRDIISNYDIESTIKKLITDKVIEEYSQSIIDKLDENDYKLKVLTHLKPEIVANTIALHFLKELTGRKE